MFGVFIIEQFENIIGLTMKFSGGLLHAYNSHRIRATRHFFTLVR